MAGQEARPSEDPVAAFIARWDGTEQAERANYISFLDDLCMVLGVPRPDPAAGPLGDTAMNAPSPTARWTAPPPRAE